MTADAIAPLVGYGAAILGTLCWLPQVIKTLRTRAVRDLSLSTNVLLLGTVLLWLCYGLLQGDWPLILANIVSGACVAALVGAKLAWGDTT